MASFSLRPGLKWLTEALLNRLFFRVEMASAKCRGSISSTKIAKRAKKCSSYPFQSRPLAIPGCLNPPGSCPTTQKTVSRTALYKNVTLMVLSVRGFPSVSFCWSILLCSSLSPPPCHYRCAATSAAAPASPLLLLLVLRLLRCCYCCF